VQPLQRILDAYPQVDVTIWGPKFEALSHHARVRHLGLVRPYERFFSRFAREQFDIGLAPLPDQPFYRCKSNNKFREYAACGVAGVYSDMSVYNTSVVDGRTGLLVNNDEQAWFNAIARLISDEPLRTRIARDARSYARDAWNEQATDAEWMEQLERLAGRRRAGAVVPRAPTGVKEPRSYRGGGRLFGAVLGLANHAWQLGIKAVPVLRRHGVRESSRRVRGHINLGAQFLAWEINRWRLQRRMSSPK
jgi:hypothetical protein